MVELCTYCHETGIGKSNGLFHRLLRPPCRPLPATCSAPSAPARQRRPSQRGPPGGRPCGLGVGDGPPGVAHQTGLAWPLLAPLSHTGGGHRSNGLFHRLLRPPCRPLPATCSAPSAPARQRRPSQRGPPGGRPCGLEVGDGPPGVAHQTGLAWPLLARLSHAGGGHRSILQPQASRPGAEPRRLSRR